MKFLFVFLTVVITTVYGNYDQVKLVNNGYEGIVIGINPDVPEDPKLIDSLKTMWTDASKVLYQATKNQAFFKDITIQVPATWSMGEVDGKFSYIKADVKVDKANPEHGDKPYTKRIADCGQPGEYIHLTPNYITDDANIAIYGPRGKTMVHEWAQLRWGVFDENSGVFYYRSDDTLEASRCPASLEGENLHFYEDDVGNQVSEPCEIDKNTALPIEGESCEFVPKDVQSPDITTSLMSHYELEQVVHFCHDDSSDPMNVHNTEATNEHNSLCEQRSAWNVITSHGDFTGQHPDPSISNLVPKFNLVKAKANKKFVLVLDTSGSMASSSAPGADSKMQNAISAANEFIMNYVPTNSYVGIIDFDSISKINSKLMLLKNENDRNNLVDLLPVDSDANGFTTIYLGVDDAVKMLKESGSTHGEEILILTDGQGDWKESTGEEVKKNGIVFNTIYFGLNSGNDYLTQLTNDTSGLWTNAIDLETLQETFKMISQVDSGNTADKSFQIKSESVSVSGSSKTGSVSIDSTIGKNTIFSFTYSGSGVPNIELYNPSGTKYCSENHSVGGCDKSTTGKVDESFKKITFKIPGLATSGTWIYNFIPTYSTTITVSVSSMAADPNVEPITVTSTMSTTSIKSAAPMVVYAQITQGYQPITNAEVHAIVTDPYGVTTDLILQDQGTAPDIRKSDGVYSKYFVDYSARGRYSVKVQVNGGGSMSNSTFTSSNTYVIDSTYIDPFERVESLGGFEYTGEPISDAIDLFQPSKIIDLKAEQVDVDDIEQGFRLIFTAPGDDLDKGTAQQYEIRYALNDTSSLVTDFDSSTPLESSSISFGDLEAPRSAGSEEVFLAKLDDLPTYDQILKVGFAVRAYDEAGNAGDVSNVALLDFFLVPPSVFLNPCIGRNGEIFYGQVFPVPGDCTKFVQCESTGQAIEQTCTPGLVFSPTELVCDFPQNVPACQ